MKAGVTDMVHHRYLLILYMGFAAAAPRHGQGTQAAKPFTRLPYSREAARNHQRGGAEAQQVQAAVAP